MAWYPISHTVPQYVDGSGAPYSGAVLKAYSAGTTTPIYIAIDSTGATQVGSIALNSNGYPSVSGNVVIPYLNEKYKLMLYPDQASADANTGAIWNVDGVPISGDFGSATQLISTTTALDSSDNNNHIEASGTITITYPDISDVGSGFVNTVRNAGSGVVTLTAGSSDNFNGGSDAGSVYLFPGDFTLVQSGANWAAGISRKKKVFIYSGFHTTPDADEIPLNGSSIALTSGGTYNGAYYSTAYQYLWNNLDDTRAPVAGGRGATAVADFAANKKITLPDYRDYALIGLSSGGSITTMGATAGASTVTPTGSVTINGVTLTASNMAALSYTVSLNGGSGGAGAAAYISDTNSTNSAPNSTATSAVSTNAGGSSFTPTGTISINAASVLQKSAAVNWFLSF